MEEIYFLLVYIMIYGDASKKVHIQLVKKKQKKETYYYYLKIYDFRIFSKKAIYFNMTL